MSHINIMKRSYNGEIKNIVEKGYTKRERKGDIFQSEMLNERSSREITNRNSLNQLLDKKPSILTMKNEWTTYSSIGVQRKILKQNTKMIKDFMNSLSVPSWYRGVSVFQKKSADLLLNAIRDDCAQRTVYRTMRCLESIGLDPLPSKKQLHTILPLCGGSDLALLWFLMEWLYRDTESDSYSVNEQLIMTSIAHLDMNTTLRELDRILPPGQNTKTVKPQRRKGKCRRRCSNKSLSNKGNSFPYFEKLPQPQLRKYKHIDIELKRKAVLDCYPHHFLNPSNMEPNDSHRWFQNYNIQDKKRTVQNYGREEVNSLLNNFEAAKQIDIDYLRNSFDAQLDVIAKKKIEESYKRQINRFDNDIEKNRHESYNLTRNVREDCASKVLTNKSDSENNNKICLSGQTFKFQNTESSADKSGSSISPDKYILSSKSSENDSETKYFIASQDQQQFKMNYCKIFAYEDNHSEIDGHSIALNVLKKQSQLDSYHSEDFENVSTCIDKIWQQELMKHKRTEFTTTIKKESYPSVVDYGLDYYDPDDDKLMDSMLKDALNTMKQDHKFVFASIPAAHRFPMLREWIRLRYGKTYRKEELTRSFQESIPIFQALAKVGLPVELPSNADMGKDLIIDYSCRDYVLRKSNYIRNEYYRRIDKAMLAQSRVIFFAMRPFLCSNGPPRNTIFAYMPAHKRENYHFRPWKLEECMKQKQVNYFQRHSQPSNRAKLSNGRLRSSQKK